MATTYPWPVRYLPGKLVCNEGDTAAIKEYEAMTDDQKKVKGGLWWSMHDIVDVFGGFIKEENDANYFNYILDLSSPETMEARIVEPNLITGVDTVLVTKFTDLSNEIRNDFTNQALINANNSSAAVANAAAANRLTSFPGQQGAPVMGAAPVGVAQIPGVSAESKYSARNLEKECLKDLARVPITSKSRVFVVQKDLLPATAAMIERLKKKGDYEAIKEVAPTGLNLNEVPVPAPGMPAMPMAPAMPAAPVLQLGPAPGVTQVGGIIPKTRKGKKRAHKKRVTRRRRRKVVPL
jgi:hypothetical protein